MQELTFMEATKDFSPKAFLRKRHPERFSDSIIEAKGNLDRAFLEYYLSTLNSRSQELQFESFSKAICEKVICSNLLEQTGPVAGGDGKTDTQTFPVAEQNRLMWYEGINDTSHKERWAFAVSTRKDWKMKCKEDVGKISGTGRGYVKAFNLTNQYTKANQRSELEDSLSKEYGIDVRILDLSWLLDQVFKSDLQGIAIEKLSIPVSYERNVILGGGDYKKDAELANLNRKIGNDVEPKNITFEQVDWFLTVAELSAELEKPEMECRGLYDRAIKIAEKFGSNQQRLNAYYGYAWKSHFWLEDIELFEENLIKAVGCIIDSTSSTKWEKVVTLLNLYNGHLKVTGCDSNIAIDEIGGKVVAKLNEIAADETKPSNALLAETLLEILKFSSVTTLNNAASIFVKIKKIVEKSQSLIGYPFEKIFDLFNKMDDVFDEVVEYEDLMDFLIENSSKRDGEIQGSIKYLKRGFKRLEAGKPFQAIKLIGKALSGLYKEETNDAIIIGLRAMSSAYEAIGLVWAARASSLFASSLLIDDFWKFDHVSEQQVKSFIRLCWLELKLGRLGQALQWYELANVIQYRLGKQIISDEECINLDGFISHLLLNARLNSLKNLENIPNVLNRLGLFNSSVFLQFSLGHDQEIKDLFHKETNEGLFEYLVLVRDYDFGVKTPEIKSLNAKRGELKTYVLGCSISINFPLRTPFLEMSESILSIIESFFATGCTDELHAKEAKLVIEVIADDDDGISISHDVDDSGRVLHVNVTCSDFDVETINKKAQTVLHDWVVDFLIEILCRTFYVKDPIYFAKQLIDIDNGLERAISFSSSFAATYNIIGKNALEDAKKLFSEKLSTEFTLKREQDWDVRHPKNNKIDETRSYSRGTSEAPEGLIDHESLKHNDIAVQSLIKPRLWDKAKWEGVAYSLYPDGIPSIDLIFTDEAAGEEVITDLIDEVGINNNQSRLLVNILKGVSVENPYSYRVQICEDFNNGSSSQLMTTISRINTMTPVSSENLRSFTRELERSGRCRLGFGAIRNEQVYRPANAEKKYIYLESLKIMDAWEVEINSIESTAIQLTDNIIIPEEVKNAPVLKVINRYRNMQR